MTGRRDSNPLPPAWKAGALAKVSYCRVAGVGRARRCSAMRVEARRRTLHLLPEERPSSECSCQLNYSTPVLKSLPRDGIEPPDLPREERVLCH